MQQYLDLLQDVLDHGDRRSDRTGTGTIGVFGRQMRFDLGVQAPIMPDEHGQPYLYFPLLTTKRVFWKGVVAELLWLISGSTNIKPLVDQGVSIWNEWADENGALGPVYGKQWRRWEHLEFVTPTEFAVPAFTPRNGLVAGIGTCSSRDASEENKALYSIWNEMLHRCYDPSRPRYADYGGRGVHVHERWHSFENFVEDAKILPNWVMKLANWSDYSLDKDYSATNRYGPDTCLWLSTKEQNLNTRRLQVILATSPSGRTHKIVNVADFCRDYGLEFSHVYKCVRGDRKSHKGWRFEAAEIQGDVVPRIRIIDQLANVIEGIKADPFGRRHIVTAWNPAEIDQMALPPCHMMFQFHVSSDRKLSCQLYQRSADLFLGVPFNIASYALLTRMVAQVCDLRPGEFIWTGGDCHIYQNHVEQVHTQLDRLPGSLPTLLLNPEITDIDDFTEHDILLEGYHPLPSIKAPVAV